MSQENQAEADPIAEPMVDDPLDASNVPDEGATELANYLNEVDGMEMGDHDGAAEAPEENADGLPHSIAVDEDEAGEGDEKPDDAQGAEPASEEEESDDEPEGEPANKSDRFRIRAKDEIEAEALAMRKRHPEWSLKECISKAEQVLGVNVEQSATQEQEQGREEVRETPTVAKLSDEIKELRQRRDQANLALEVEEAAEIQREIDELQDRREELRYHEMAESSRQEQQYAEQFERQYASSEEKAVRLYPDTMNPDSEMVKRMIELDAHMRENGDPLYHSSDKPFLLAKEAAKELGIIMADPSKAQSAAQKTSPKNVVPMQPASGSARTTAPAPGRKLDDALGDVDSLEDYERLVGAL